MASIARPVILGYSIDLAAAGSFTASPGAGSSWEVHSVIVDGAFTSGSAYLDRQFDPDKDADWEVSTRIYTFTQSEELHAWKLELDEYSRLRVYNNTSGPIDVVLLGIVIT